MIIGNSFVIIGNSSSGRQITLYSKLAIELYSYNNIFKNLFKEKKLVKIWSAK